MVLACNVAEASLFDGLQPTFVELNRNYPKREMTKAEAAAIVRMKIYHDCYRDLSYTADEEGFVFCLYRCAPFKIRFESIAAIKYYKTLYQFYNSSKQKMLTVRIDATCNDPNGANRRKLFGSVLSDEGTRDFISALLTLCPNVGGGPDPGSIRRDN